MSIWTLIGFSMKKQEKPTIADSSNANMGISKTRFSNSPY
jgi:hypothetical protein